MENEPILELTQFFPYRLSNLQAAVSDAVGRLYNPRYSLTHQEWRVMATLAEFPGWVAKEVAAHANLEKMQVSRAVSRLAERGLLVQASDEHDRRALRLRLTEQGESLYDEIVPLVRERERALLEALCPEEKAVLEAAMDKLLERTRQLAEYDAISPDH